jgi:hypothetical protein
MQTKTLIQGMAMLSSKMTKNLRMRIMVVMARRGMMMMMIMMMMMMMMMKIIL